MSDPLQKSWTIKVERRRDGGTFEAVTTGSWDYGHDPTFGSPIPVEAVSSLKEIVFGPLDDAGDHEVRVGEWTYRFGLTLKP